jgi:hypothetical protein
MPDGTCPRKTLAEIMGALLEETADVLCGLPAEMGRTSASFDLVGGRSKPARAVRNGVPCDVRRTVARLSDRYDRRGEPATEARRSVLGSRRRSCRGGAQLGLPNRGRRVAEEVRGNEP